MDQRLGGAPRDGLQSEETTAPPPFESGPRRLGDCDGEPTVSLGPEDLDVLVSGNRAARVRGPSALPPGVGRRFGPYELLGRLAQGGMAEIYLARQVAEADLQRHIVLKCIQPAVSEQEHFIRLFLREARVALRLKHPNVCHVYDFGRQDGRYYLAMEWVEGATLLELLRRAFEDGQYLPLPIVLKVVADVAEALDCVHRVKDDRGHKLGVVHRDVSPQNVAIAWEGTVKLLDFGVAKVHGDTPHTQAGTVAGKFGYMSPEQCREERVDGRCDVFALGVILYEALVGRRLYHRRNDYETMRAILEEPPPRIRKRRPSLPEELEEIVLTALAKAPEDRYGSAGELALALQRLLASRGELVSSGRVADTMACYFAADIRRGLPVLVTDTELLRSLPKMGPGPPRVAHTGHGGALARAPEDGGGAPLRGSASTGSRRAGRSLERRTGGFVMRRPWASLGIAALLAGFAFVTGWAAGGQWAAETTEPAAVEQPEPGPDRGAPDRGAMEASGR
jgi:eukaryotic-like serine/threonine-protein kinase